MPLTFTLDPAVTPELRDGLLDLWTDVSNAGGAVGYVPPVTREEIRPALVQHFASMAEGRVKLLVGYDEEWRPVDPQLGRAAAGFGVDGDGDARVGDLQFHPLIVVHSPGRARLSGCADWCSG